MNILKNQDNNNILIAQKMLHKGQLFGHISNGAGQIILNDDYAIKFIVQNDKFVTLELYHYSIKSTPANQSWRKTKVVKDKKKEEEIKFNINQESKELF